MGWIHVGVISMVIAMGNAAVLSQIPFYRDSLGQGTMLGIMVRNYSKRISLGRFCRLEF